MSRGGEAPGIGGSMTQVTVKASLANSPLAWMSGALIGFCAAALSMRGLSSRFDPIEANLFRSAGGLLCVLAFMAATRERPRAVSWGNVGAHLARNSFHWVGALLWTMSIATLPLATVFALEFTTPIWVAIFAVGFLGRRLSAAAVGALCLGFLGVLIVVAPSPTSIDRNAVFPLTTAVFFAVAILMTKTLTRRNSAANVVFWMMASHTVANLACLAWLSGFGRIWENLAQGGPELWLLPTLVLGGLVSQSCLTKALERGNEVVVMTLDFLRLPLIAVAGYLIYGETVGLHTALGGGAILAAVAIVTVWGKPERAPAKPAPGAEACPT